MTLPPLAAMPQPPPASAPLPKPLPSPAALPPIPSAPKAPEKVSGFSAEIIKRAQDIYVGEAKAKAVQNDKPAIGASPQESRWGKA